MINRYAICYNPVLSYSKEAVNKLQSLLDKSKVEYDTFSLDDMKSGYDFIFVIGGDGTILKTARFYSKLDIPVFGINMGHLGFLSQACEDDLTNAVEQILKGNYKIEKRLMLKCGSTSALNDFVIKGADSTRAFKCSLEIDSKFVCEYFSDGLIISTPTGSTAYGMSAGGPVLAPELQNLEIVPICPHTFSARPLVISSDSVLKITVPDEQKYYVCADGQDTFEFHKSITISKENYCAKLALLKNNDFYKVLRNKLHWGITPC